jgi:exonuclease III
MDDILNDYDTMQSDILCLQETYMALCMQNKQFPNHNHATFSNILNVLSNALDHLHLNETIFIVGDFNIDMLQNNARTKELENYMCKYSFHFLLNKTSHVQNTLIDHVWSNVPISQYNVFILDTYWYDHDTIGIALEL